MRVSGSSNRGWAVGIGVSFLVLVSTQRVVADIDVIGYAINAITSYASGNTIDPTEGISIIGKRPDVNFKNDSDALLFLGGGFGGVAQESGIFAQSIDAAIPAGQEDANTIPAVTTEPLFYPNPFRQSEGSRLGYRLSKAMELTVQLYNMRSDRIAETIFKKGSVGGMEGYNKVLINDETFNGYKLSAGVYFYVLIFEGRVLARGKMAVIP